MPTAPAYTLSFFVEIVGDAYPAVPSDAAPSLNTSNLSGASAPMSTILLLSGDHAAYWRRFLEPGCRYLFTNLMQVRFLTSKWGLSQQCPWGSPYYRLLLVQVVLLRGQPEERLAFRSIDSTVPPVHMALHGNEVVIAPHQAEGTLIFPDWLCDLDTDSPTAVAPQSQLLTVRDPTSFLSQLSGQSRTAARQRRRAHMTESQHDSAAVLDQTQLSLLTGRGANEDDDGDTGDCFNDIDMVDRGGSATRQARDQASSSGADMDHKYDSDEPAADHGPVQRFRDVGSHRDVGSQRDAPDRKAVYGDHATSSAAATALSFVAYTGTVTGAFFNCLLELDSGAVFLLLTHHPSPEFVLNAGIRPGALRERLSDVKWCGSRCKI